MIGTSKSFFIDERYEPNPAPKPAYYLDDVPEATGITWQPDVYDDAAAHGAQLGAVGMIDLGCGRAAKLAAVRDRYPDWRFTGVDFWDNLTWCRENLPWGRWIEHDLEDRMEQATVEYIDPRRKIVVCADVIEHLIDPRGLLSTARGMLDAGALAVVWSTPDRELTYGPEHLGPPPNLCHVREWTAMEFSALLVDAGFVLREARHTRSDDTDPAKHATIYVATS